MSDAIMDIVIDRPKDLARAREDIRAFINASGELPSPKGVAVKLMQLARDPDVGMQEIARLVKTDPALTAFVLRAANSARFAGRSRVIDVTQAVTRLGIDMVRVYAIAVSMLQQYGRGRCPAFDYTGFWARSLYAGIVMSEVAERGEFLYGEEAFALGLLCQVGRLTFATAAPEDYAQLIKKSGGSDERLRALERDACGFDHNELTAVLLVEWGIPTKLADVVFWQQDPEAGGFACDSLEHRLAGEIQLAVLLADLSFSPADRAREETPAVVLRAQITGMAADALLALSGRVTRAWTEWASGLQLAARPRALEASALQ